MPTVSTNHKLSWWKSIFFASAIIFFIPQLYVLFWKNIAIAAIPFFVILVNLGVGGFGGLGAVSFLVAGGFLEVVFYVFFFAFLIRKYGKRALLSLAIILSIVNAIFFFIPGITAFSVLDNIASKFIVGYNSYNLQLEGGGAAFRNFPEILTAFHGTILSPYIKPILDATFWVTAIIGLITLLSMITKMVPRQKKYIALVSLPILVLIFFSFSVGAISSFKLRYIAKGYFIRAETPDDCLKLYPLYIFEYNIVQDCRAKIAVKLDDISVCEKSNDKNCIAEYVLKHPNISLCEKIGPYSGRNWSPYVYEVCKNNFFHAQTIWGKDESKLNYIKNFLTIEFLSPMDIILTFAGSDNKLACEYAASIKNRGSRPIHKIRLHITYHPEMYSGGRREEPTRDTGLFWDEKDNLEPNEEYQLCLDSYVYPLWNIKQDLPTAEITHFDFVE